MLSLSRIPTICWIAADALTSLGAAWFVINSNEVISLKFQGSNLGLICIICGMATSISGLVVNLYSLTCLRSWTSFIPKALATSMGSTILTVAFGYFIFFIVPGRWVTIYLFFTVLFPIFFLRLPFLLFRQYLKVRILLIGSQLEIDHVETLLTSAGPHAYALGGFLAIDAISKEDTGQQTIRKLCDVLGIDEVVLPSSRALIDHCFWASLGAVQRGCKITTLPALIENETQQVPLDLVDASWLIGESLDLRNQLVEAVKRVFDILLGSIGMISTLPILMILAPLIRLTTKGPVFYSQLRTGRFGVPFKIYKIRTMNIDAEAGGAQWAKTNDPRVTWYGSLLRRSRLDETPQFLNIFLGHMSFVGPRPERPEFVHKLVGELPYFSMRHLVRPGLTGWAQISYRYGASIDDSKQKLKFDLYYVRHQSLLFDLFIVLRTILAMMKGAR